MSLVRTLRVASVVAAIPLGLGVASTVAEARPPVIVSATQNGTGVSLRFFVQPGRSIIAYRKVGSSPRWSRRGSVANNGRYWHSFVDASPVAGQRNCYAIGSRTAGTSRVEISQEVCLSPVGAPRAPDSARFTGVSHNQIDFVATDRATNELGFFIERKRWINGETWKRVKTFMAARGTGAVLKFVDTAVNSEYKYCYRMAAYNQAATVYGPIRCATTAARSFSKSPNALLAITTLSHPGSNAIQVAWVERSTTASEYTVERSAGPAGGYPRWLPIMSVRDHRPAASVGGTLSVTDTGLDPSDSYCYRVTMLEGGRKRTSNTVCESPFQRTDGQPPQGVSLRLGASLNREIAATWTAPTGTLGSFLEAWEPNNGVGFTQQGSLRSGAGSFAGGLRSLNANTRYCLRAVAYNRFGSTASPILCARTTNVRPGAPRNVHATVVSNDQIRIAWDSVAQADNYEINWTGRKPGFVYKDGARVINVPRLFLSGARGYGYTYCFEVKATNSLGRSAASNEMCVTTPARGDRTNPPMRYETCGTSCDSGFHIVVEEAVSSCGNGTATNRVTCEENTGPQFQTCALACPSGYHSTLYSNTVSCDPRAPDANQTTCVQNSGASFDTCDSSCPSGYDEVDTSYARACRQNLAGPDWANARTCEP